MAEERRRTGEASERAENGASPSPPGPEAIARDFGRALLARNPRAAAAYFAASAHILTPDGTEIAGRSLVADVLGQITSSDHELEIRLGRTVVNGTVALCTQYWRRRPSRSSGGLHELSTMARLVLARSGERWEIVIASPWE